jgi:hypothetical protein
LGYVTRENISETAFQARHDLVQTSQRDALLALFKPMKRRRGHANLPRKLGERSIPSGLAQKLGKLLIKKTRHNLVLALTSFPDAGNSPFPFRNLP